MTRSGKRNSLRKVCSATAAAAVLALAVPVEAKDYYVSLSGSDEHDGLSPSTAWQTLAKVNAIDFRPGDRIFSKAGRFSEASSDLMRMMPVTRPIRLSSRRMEPVVPRSMAGAVGRSTPITSAGLRYETSTSSVRAPPRMPLRGAWSTLICPRIGSWNTSTSTAWTSPALVLSVCGSARTMVRQATGTCGLLTLRSTITARMACTHPRPSTEPQSS